MILFNKPIRTGMIFKMTIMILFNKLIRADLIFALAILSLFFITSGAIRDGILGFVTALFIISIVNHIRHYGTYKKFY